MTLFAVFILIFFLTARVSHFVVDDSLTAPIRDRFSLLADKGVQWDAVTNKPKNRTLSNRFFGFLTNVTDCVNCASVWAAAFFTWVVYASDFVNAKFIVWAALAAGASYLTGVVADWRYHKQQS